MILVQHIGDWGLQSWTPTAGAGKDAANYPKEMALGPYQVEIMSPVLVYTSLDTVFWTGNVWKRACISTRLSGEQRAMAKSMKTSTGLDVEAGHVPPLCQLPVVLHLLTIGPKWRCIPQKISQLFIGSLAKACQSYGAHSQVYSVWMMHQTTLHFGGVTVA